MHFRIPGILTICFSVYLFDESRFTASIWPKSISCPRRKINSSLHTYFFFWYPSNCLSPERKRWTFEAVKSSCNKLVLNICNKIISLQPSFNLYPVQYNIHTLTFEFIPNICKFLVYSLHFSFFRFTWNNVSMLDYRDSTKFRGEVKRRELIDCRVVGFHQLYYRHTCQMQ